MTQQCAEFELPFELQIGNLYGSQNIIVSCLTSQLCAEMLLSCAWPCAHPLFLSHCRRRWYCWDDVFCIHIKDQQYQIYLRNFWIHIGSLAQHYCPIPYYIIYRSSSIDPIDFGVSQQTWSEPMSNGEPKDRKICQELKFRGRVTSISVAAALNTAAHISVIMIISKQERRWNKSIMNESSATTSMKYLTLKRRDYLYKRIDGCGISPLSKVERPTAAGSRQLCVYRESARVKGTPSHCHHLEK